MEKVPVGRSELKITRVGLGTATFGREIDEETSRTILDYAVGKGINLLDTAEGYGGGNAKAYRKKHLGLDDAREVSTEMHSSEKIIGRWLRDRGCRQELVILTKVGTGGSPENIQRAVGESLERLQIDAIDIYMMHSADPGIPLRETLHALTEEVQVGRIRTIGCSNYRRDQLQEALELHARDGYARMNSTEPPLSLANTCALAELLPFCRNHQVATITYSPLAAGFLTGKYTPSPADLPEGARFHVIPGHVDIYFSERNFRILENLRRLAEEVDQSMVHLAMAWATGHPLASSVLVGARERAHLDNALRTLEQPLAPELRAIMDAWLQAG